MSTNKYFWRNYRYCPSCKTKLHTVKNSLVCPGCGFVIYDNPLPTVAIVFEREGNLLFSKRGIAPEKNRWDFPGGFVEPGESAEQAAIRETKEETNLVIQSPKILGTIPEKYQDRATICLIFQAIFPENGQPTAQDDVAKLQWFPIDAPPKNLAFPNVEFAVRIMKERHHAK